eukprot:scaffold31518_cov56-Cyclotella_meneghiniana.AAC.9
MPPLRNVAKNTTCGTSLAARMEDPLLLQVLVLISGMSNGQMGLVTMIALLEELTAADWQGD